MQRIYLTLFSLVLFFMGLILPTRILSQHVLFQDINTGETDHDYANYLDSLEAHSITTHYVSSEGYANIINMDMFWT
ncbi:hypothetical protein J7L01_01090, partial [bacterium]|nr:hypothetical protein [bacterium]